MSETFNPADYAPEALKLHERAYGEWQRYGAIIAARAARKKPLGELPQACEAAGIELANRMRKLKGKLHSVAISLGDDDRREEREMTDWCRLQFKGHMTGPRWAKSKLDYGWKANDDVDLRLVFFFRDSSDATLFRLTFG